MIVDTASNGWTRVGVHELGWRKSLRRKHWAEIRHVALGWEWEILRVDPVTMCAVRVADGMDTSLAAAKDDVDHWNDNYQEHAVVAHLEPQGLWSYQCRLCRQWGLGVRTYDNLIAHAADYHTECEAAWQRGER